MVLEAGIYCLTAIRFGISPIWSRIGVGKSLILSLVAGRGEDIALYDGWILDVIKYRDSRHSAGVFSLFWSV
jgi:hypothetical protein